MTKLNEIQVNEKLSTNVLPPLIRHKRQSCRDYYFHRLALEFLKGGIDIGTIHSLALFRLNFWQRRPDCASIVGSFLRGKSKAAAIEGLTKYVKDHPCHRDDTLNGRQLADQVLGSASDAQAFIEFYSCIRPPPPPPAVRTTSSRQSSVNWNEVKNGLLVAAVVLGAGALVVGTGGAAAPALAVG